MAGPVALGVDRRLGQRQQGTRRQHAILADDDGPVMERRAAGEDRAQEVGRDVAVDHHAGLGDLLEPGLPFHDDQRAVPVARQSGRRRGHLVGDPLDGAQLRPGMQPGERTDTADPVERAPQLGLEDDDEGEQRHDRAALEDLAEQPEPQDLGEAVDEQQDRDADDQANRLRAADEAEQPVDEECRDPDVEHRGQRHLSEDRLEQLLHREPSVAPRVTAPMRLERRAAVTGRSRSPRLPRGPPRRRSPRRAGPGAPPPRRSAAANPAPGAAGRSPGAVVGHPARSRAR